MKTVAAMLQRIAAMIHEMFEDDRTKTISFGKVFAALIVLVYLTPCALAIHASKPLPDIPIQWAGLVALLYLGQKTISSVARPVIQGDKGEDQ